jgi:hypothetical protein
MQWTGTTLLASAVSLTHSRDGLLFFWGGFFCRISVNLILRIPFASFRMEINFFVAAFEK